MKVVLLFQVHYAVQHELEKPLDLFWLFRPSTTEYIYNNTSYYNFYYIEIYGR